MIETGDLVLVQVRGRLHGQRVMNTLYYRALNDDPAGEEADVAPAFATDWLTLHGSMWAVPLSQELTGLVIRTQFLRPQPPSEPIRYSYYEASLTLDEGQVAQSSLPSTCTAVCRRRTALAGRRYRGRVYIPGIPVTYEADSLITQAGYDALTDNIAPILVAPLMVDAVEWQPCITDAPTHTRITDVTQASFDDVLRVQRRREVGVGE